MRKYTPYIIFFLLQLSIFPAYGQNIGIHWRSISDNQNQLIGKLRGENYYVSVIAGNFHFLQENWCNTTITLINGDRFENIKTRYLAYKDELIVFDKNVVSKYYKLDKDIIADFEFEDESNGVVQKRKFIRLYFDGADNSRYFEVLYSGTISLLAYRQIVRQRVGQVTTQSGIATDGEYRHKTNYYVYSPNTGFAKLNLKKNYILKSYPQQVSEIKDFYKKRPNFRDEKTMIELFNLIDN